MRVLILNQNATVPPDQRVWPEAQALTARGYEVHIICPLGKGYPLRRENIDGIRVYRYSPGPEGRSITGYLREYTVAILSLLFLTLVIRARRRIDVVMICNPPDLLFVVAMPLMALGARLVYDHHDACPELMIAKGFRAGSWVVRLNTLFERFTYRACDVSLEPNESFRDIALERGHMRHEDTFVVRNAPRSTRFADSRADDKYRYGRKHMVAYVGMMAIQDGLDYLIDAAHVIVADWQRNDIQFVLVGSGPELERLRERVRAMNLRDYMTFTGFISDPVTLGSVLTTADVCVGPDPANPANNISSMHKTVEYMLLRKPIVQFDLCEGRATAGEASLYAAPNDATDFAKSIVRLVDDPEMRDRLGDIGFQRITTGLNWDAQVPSLLAAYERVLAKPRTSGTAGKPAKEGCTSLQSQQPRNTLFSLGTTPTAMAKDLSATVSGTSATDGASLRTKPRPARVLMLVQNETVPPDMRVWAEAQALIARGYEVSVICPRGEQYTRRSEVVDGVRIYRYPRGPEGRSSLGYLLEYAAALPPQLFLALAVRVRSRVDVVHVCNPPDLLFLPALPLKALGARLVYDHHDACPELIMAKGYRAGGWQVQLNTLLERLTYRACDVSIETNESFRGIAIGRGRMRQDDVFVVRNGPAIARFAGATADDKHRHGREHMVAYVGMMAIQDGLDYLIDAARIIVADWQRDDIQFVLVGSGAELERLRERVRRMKLEDYITFTGYVADSGVLGSVLATADVCVSPDPENAANNVSTMIKVMEYMSFGKPIVQFDLHEGRVSAGDASLYVAGNDVTAFAKAIALLIDDPEMRDRLGAIGLQRMTDLTWDAQVPRLLAAYERALVTESAAARSYTDRHLGMLGRTRELYALWQSKRQDVPGQARKMLAELESSKSEMERAVGGTIQDKEMLIIGPGQQLVEMSFFARHNSVTGIDLDVIPQHPSVREYLRMFRNNGSVRTVKTMARKAMGYDRALRREAARAGLTVDSDPVIVAMDAAAMTFPDGSFDCVFSTSCFEHLSKPDDVIRQVARVLRPGGLAHVDVHLYTSDSGCHDVRIFGGTRDSIPPWSHLRPQYRSLVQPNSYLNEIRLVQWRELFSRHWPGVTFRLRPERDPAIRDALAALRANGELEEYEDEELLSVYLVAEWVKPARPPLSVRRAGD